MSRASRFKPSPAGRWEEDHAPIGGPRMGPFELRHEGLDAELAWLQQRLPILPRTPQALHGVLKDRTATRTSRGVRRVARMRGPKPSACVPASAFQHRKFAFSM